MGRPIPTFGDPLGNMLTLFSGGAAPVVPSILDTIAWTVKLESHNGTFQNSAMSINALADADPIGAWADQSGNGNHVLQTTDAKRPALKLNIRNGYPAIRLTRASTQWLLRTFASSLAQPNLFFLVCSLAAVDGTPQYITDGSGTSRHIIGDNGISAWRMYAGGDLVGGTRDTKINLFGALFSGTASYLRQNGNVVIAPGTTVGTQSLAALYLGSNATATANFMGGDFFAVYIKQGGLSDADRDAVEAALLTRYTLPM